MILRVLYAMMNSFSAQLCQIHAHDPEEVRKKVRIATFFFFAARYNRNRPLPIATHTENRI